MTDIIPQIITWVTGFLGLGLLQWLNTRKANKRLAEAQASQEEFHALREYNDFLQKQLTEKEERFIDQTARLRETQDALFSERQEKASLQLELALKRCERKKCADRIPQNGY